MATDVEEKTYHHADCSGGNSMGIGKQRGSSGFRTARSLGRWCE